MREIKFRGRNGDDWYYGSLFVNECGHTAISAPKSFWMKPVNAGTVGQFTGLLDSNGQEIYEGDIVKIDDLFSKDNFCKRGFRYPATVKWDGLFGRFIVKSPEIIDRVPDSKYITVIGNVHDSPELLEAEDARD